MSYERDLEISEKALGKNHPDVATTLNNLAGLYKAMGAYEKALPLYERDLEISEKALGKNHPDVATTLNNLAGLYKAMGAYEKALPLYERALGIIESALGKDHPHVATTLNNLAGLYESMGAYEKALPLYERALGIRESALGKDHPHVATTLNNLAGLYQAMGAYEKALPLYERTLAIVVEKLGKEHPNTQTIFMNFIMLRLQLAIQNRLGFDLHAVPEVKQATVQGVPLRSVQAEGMAAQADLQTGDALQQVDGQVVKSALEVVVVLMKKPAQTSVSLQVLRGAETLNLNLRLPEDYAPLAELGLE
ncbi:tetratricopeptide repeat protein [Candidatus Venteria ishoeyi]|uniref:tetratricopeptide repeat protein n=1 Tax=Candidatus Venteria ishoeyi TaxID=1899563 RepID=UPI00255CC0D8|nr:tetratricopeptide repeat protein [Candidatus Venteria ishoeyi]